MCHSILISISLSILGTTFRHQLNELSFLYQNTVVEDRQSDRHSKSYSQLISLLLSLHIILLTHIFPPIVLLLF